MYSTCLHCTRPLGANEVIETLPIGRRLAFDADKGRLWVVCRECAKWNLVPFDTRLESIEACERLYRDTKERYSTGAIGLAKAKEGLELVRIGPALLPEFASWRYGSLYRQRRWKTIRQITAANILPMGLVGVMWASTGLGSGTVLALAAVQNFLVWRMIVRGPRGMELRGHDPDSGRPIVFPLHAASQAVIRRREDGLDLAIPVNIATGRKLVFRGEAADRLARRVLGGVNGLLGSRRDLDTAVDRVAAMPLDDPRSLLERIDAFHRSTRWGGTPIAALDRHMRLAWEMHGNEEIERHWLGGELALLEREWREAEQLAKIADDLAHASRLTTQV